MSEARLWFVVINCPDDAIAEAIGRAALEAGLAKMYNISAAMRSAYEWRGEFVERSEVQLSFKVDGRLREPLFALAKARHPFDVPSIIAWPIDAADADYHRHITGGRGT